MVSDAADGHYAITWRSDYNAAGTPATVENHTLTAIINSNHTVSLSGTNITSITMPFDARDLVVNDANTQGVQADATLLNLPGSGATTIEPPAPDSSPDAVLQTQTTLESPLRSAARRPSRRRSPTACRTTPPACAR